VAQDEPIQTPVAVRHGADSGEAPISAPALAGWLHPLDRDESGVLSGIYNYAETSPG